MLVSTMIVAIIVENCYRGGVNFLVISYKIPTLPLLELCIGMHAPAGTLPRHACLSWNSALGWNYALAEAEFQWRRISSRGREWTHQTRNPTCINLLGPRPRMLGDN